jgi:hypothetical protein
MVAGPPFDRRSRTVITANYPCAEDTETQHGVQSSEERAESLSLNQYVVLQSYQILHIVFCMAVGTEQKRHGDECKNNRTKGPEPSNIS